MDFWNKKPKKLKPAEQEKQTEPIKSEKPVAFKEPRAKLEDSDYVKAWKAIPKEKRDKLTKKQIEHMNKHDIMSDAIIINYEDD